MPGETEKPNFEGVQELSDLFVEGDIESIRDITDPDVKLHEPRGLANGETLYEYSLKPSSPSISLE